MRPKMTHFWVQISKTAMAHLCKKQWVRVVLEMGRMMIASKATSQKSGRVFWEEPLILLNL